MKKREQLRSYNSALKTQNLELVSERGRALCDRTLWTPPGPEGSNGKRSVLCAPGSPGPAFPRSEECWVL